MEHIRAEHLRPPGLFQEWTKCDNCGKTIHLDEWNDNEGDCKECRETKEEENNEES